MNIGRKLHKNILCIAGGNKTAGRNQLTFAQTIHRFKCVRLPVGAPVFVCFFRAGVELCPGKNVVVCVCVSVCV